MSCGTFHCPDQLDLACQATAHTALSSIKGRMEPLVLIQQYNPANMSISITERMQHMVGE